MPTGATHSASSERRTAWVLPEALRPTFQQRYGPVYTGGDFEREVRKLSGFATCGDRVTGETLACGCIPLLGVVDFKTQRNEPIDPLTFAPLASRHRRKVWNPAGMISEDLRDAVRDMVDHGGGLVEVEGEEDLAVMPLIECLPVGSSVLYGIPGEGVCFLAVDNAAKERVATLYRKMEHRTFE